MNFCITENLNDERIIDFILKDPRATIYHHPAWLKAISDGINKEGRYLLISEHQTIKGLIPFIIYHNKFVSLPFTTHCTPLLPEDIIFEDLIIEINQLFNKVKGFRFTFREENLSIPYQSVSDYYSHRIQLENDADKMFNSFLNRKIRRFIKRSNENGFILKLGKDEKDLQTFYKLECKLRKSLGLPPAPYKFFISLWKNLFPKDLMILPIVIKDSIPVAASIVLKFKKEVIIEYTALDKKFINLYPNHFLHWEIIKKSINEYRADTLDMGRTDKRQSGLIFFKESWNADRTNLIEVTNSKDKCLKQSFIYSCFRKINKLFPEKLLILEGKLLFKYFE